jgi:hypothetical protein
MANIMSSQTFSRFFGALTAGEQFDENFSVRSFRPEVPRPEVCRELAKDVATLRLHTDVCSGNRDQCYDYEYFCRKREKIVTILSQKQDSFLRVSDPFCLTSSSYLLFF